MWQIRQFIKISIPSMGGIFRGCFCCRDFGRGGGGGSGLPFDSRDCDGTSLVR